MPAGGARIGRQGAALIAGFSFERLSPFSDGVLDRHCYD
jgi:hypothetical protein